MSVCKINGFEISSKTRIDKKDVSDYFQGQHILIQPFLWLIIYDSYYMNHIQNRDFEDKTKIKAKMNSCLRVQ